MHADEVCTKDSVTEETARILISLTKITLCPSSSEPKMSFAASGAIKKSPTAAGKDTAKVIKIAFKDCFFASAKFPLSARGEICGTPEAASP